MGRPKTIPFEPEKFKLTEHNKETIETFESFGYKFRVSSVGALYGVKGREFKLLDQVHLKSGFSNWFWEQFE